MVDYEIEPSVQMRLYTLNKRHFALIFMVFFICFTTTVLVGFFGPPIMEQTIVNATTLTPPPTDPIAGPFVLKSPPVTSFHQQLWLTAHIQLMEYGGTFNQPLSMRVLLRGLANDETKPIIYNSRQNNLSRSLQCTAQSCDAISILHLEFLAFPAYVVNVNISGLKAAMHPVKDIQFLFTTYNSSFTQLEIWFRFFFLLLTFVFTCIFAHSLRKFSIHDWSIEQKWMTLLLPLLLLYDDPMFPATFLVNSCAPTIVDILLQVTFLSALLLYWLCIYHGVRQTKRSFAVFYMPKLLLVGVLWVSVVTVLSWQSYQQTQDPTYNYTLDSPSFLGYKIFVGIIAGLYLLYLVYLLIRAYTELRSMPYFDLRLKFMTVLMLLVISLGVTITILRFGTGPLGDSFVASTKFHNSAEFAALYGLLNLYIFTMAFVYAPSKNAIYESHFKDNPALSMLNDSDDDVVYGEDTSLTRQTRIPANKYDSDEEAFN